MMDFLFAFCFATVGTLPYRLLAYYPFRRQLRFPVWGVALIVGTAQLLQSLLFAWLNINGGGGANLLQAVFAPACFLIFLLCVRADFWKIVFLYLFVFDYTVLVRGVARYAECVLFYSPAMTFFSLRSMLIQLIILAVTAPIMILILKQTKDRVFQADAVYGGLSSFWRSIWILPAITTMIVMLYTSGQSPEQVRQFRFLLSCVLLLAGMISVYYVLIRALDIIRREAALEEKAAQQEHLLALQRTQYSQISRYMNETRQARHDLAQHLRLINQYLSTGNQEDLREYVRQYEAALPPNTSRVFCKNYAVNTILSYYYEEAQNSGIRFTANLELPGTLPISEPEFCSMLGNLLENALLSCREATDTAPFIQILADQAGGFLLIAIDNTCAQEPVRKDGRLCSSRHEGFGLGTASVSTIAARGGGSADFTCRDGVFYASVSLKLPE